MKEEELRKFTVSKDTTIEKALETIELNSHRSAVVIDDNSKVIGTVSDGDIRKAILSRRLLSTPVSKIMNLNFIALRPGKSEDANELFQKYHIFIVPIVDDSNRLLDIILSY